MKGHYLKTRLVDHCLVNNKLMLGQETQYTYQSTKDLAEIEQMRWTGSYEGSGGAALIDNLNKALQISMDVYYFLYFQDCENLLFIA